MDRLYRVIWNVARSAWVVVGELAQGRGKKGGRKRTRVRALDKTTGQASILGGMALLLSLTAVGPAFADGGNGGSGSAGGVNSSTAPGGDGSSDTVTGGGGGAGTTGGTGGDGSGGPGGTGGQSAGAAGDPGSNTGAGAHGFVDVNLPSSDVFGGAGGAGADGSGGGGAGGHGAVVEGNSVSGTISSSLIGGAGGVGGKGDVSVIDGAGGGSGGDGLAFTDSSAEKTITVDSSGDIKGGTGGAGGVAGVGGNDGKGGYGGNGIFGSKITVTNNGGFIIGGDGGAGSTAGAGGIGILGSNLTIINSGTIKGGTGSGGLASAIVFTGGSNVLELQSGSDISGDVLGVVGGHDTLRLGGSVNDNFDVSQLGSGSSGKYRNFTKLEKTGSSIWTLSGSTPGARPWTVSDGTLVVSTSSALGTGSVNVSGATLTSEAAVSGISTAILQNNATWDGTGSLSASTFDVRSGDASVSLVGSGSLTKSTAGRVTLSGDNSAYSGHITVSAGNLVAASSTALGTGSVNVNGATLTVNDALSGISNIILQNNATWDGSGSIEAPTFDVHSGDVSVSLTGTGDLTKTTVGTVTLSGDNSAYSGGTTVLGGTLVANSSSALGTGVVDVNGATSILTANSAVSGISDIILQNNATWNGTGSIAAPTFDVRSGEASVNLTGSGSLTKSTAGTVTLSGLNDYTGGTTVNAGTLVGSAASLQGDITNNAAVIFNQPNNVGVYTGVLSGTGSVEQTGGGALNFLGVNTYTGATTVNNGVLIIAPTGALNGSGGNYTDITLNNAGSGLVVSNGGVAQFNQLTINPGTIVSNQGEMQSYGNATNSGALINNGTFTINGLSLLTNNAGARISGNGSFSGPLLNNGIIAPGNSIGTLTVNGPLTFNPGSVYEVEVNAAGQSDRINATTVTLNGGTVQVLAEAGGYSPDILYTILNSQNPLTGTFSNATSDLVFLTPTLSYDANNVYLNFMRNSVTFSSVGVTLNQRATAGGVESLGLGATLYNVILGLTAPQAQYAFDQLSGEVNASIKTGLIEESRLIREATIGRLGAVVDETLAFWVTPFGDWGHQDGNANAATLDYSTGGLFVGGDHVLPHGWRVGAVTGYSRTHFDVQDRFSSGNSNNYYAGAYVGKHWNKLALKGGAAYTWHNIADRRSVVFPGFSNALTNSMNAGTTQVFGDLGYSLTMKRVAVEPFAGLAYVNLNTNEFQERGGVSALTGNGSAMDTTFSTLGVRAVTRFMLKNKELTAKGALGWQHAFGDVTPLASMFFAGGAPFTIAGTPLAQDAAVVGVGLEVALLPSTTLGVGYSSQFGSGLVDQAAVANLKWVI